MQADKQTALTRPHLCLKELAPCVLEQMKGSPRLSIISV